MTGRFPIRAGRLVYGAVKREIIFAAPSYGCTVRFESETKGLLECVCVVVVEGARAQEFKRAVDRWVAAQ